MDDLIKMTEEQLKKIPAEEKRLWFYLKVEKMKQEVGRGDEIYSVEPITLLIERGFLLRDSFEQFQTTSDFDLRKDLKINYIEEVSQDAGGLIRDWFSMLIEGLFSPDFGLFRRASTTEVSYLFNENSAQIKENHLKYFYFTGQVIAKALFEQIPIKAYFSKIVLKQLLNQKLSIDDIKSFDEEQWKSFEYLRNNPIPTDLAIGTFSFINKNQTTGVETLIELKENGKNIPVNDTNKEEFFQLFLDICVVKQTASQLEKFKDGFASLIKPVMIQLFDPDEFELFLCGDPTISLEDWKKHTSYKGAFNIRHPTIALFWEMLEKMDESNKEKLLLFTTGSRRLPAEGFAGLRSSNGKKSEFIIKSAFSKPGENRYIVAHTCFNTLELPEYTDISKMKASFEQVLNYESFFKFTIE